MSVMQTKFTGNWVERTPISVAVNMSSSYQFDLGWIVNPSLEQNMLEIILK